MSHPAVDLLFDQMKRRHISVIAMARRSGVCRASLDQWRRGCTYPNLANLEACLNALGYELRPALRQIGNAGVQGG